MSPSHYQGTHCVILSPGYSCYPNIIRVLIVLSYHQGTHCVILILSGYSLCYHPTIRVLIVIIPLSSGYSLCYHPTIIRVLIVLSYHQGIHCVILILSGYSLCYPIIIRVLIVLSSCYYQGTYYYQSIHGVIILLLSGYSWNYHPLYRKGTHFVYSLCYHPTIIRVLIVLKGMVFVLRVSAGRGSSRYAVISGWETLFRILKRALTGPLRAAHSYLTS